MSANQAVMHFHRPGPLLALVGNPNCGKSALFNLLTGSRQKVANYAGVTVERVEGECLTQSGKRLRVLDLPGAYSLYPRSPDERVTVKGPARWASTTAGTRSCGTAKDTVIGSICAMVAMPVLPPEDTRLPGSTARKPMRPAIGATMRV